MATRLLDRREGIIISTIEAINEVGLQNLSTKIIARNEGVSEGTIFRHFKNKTGIMLAVLDHFSQFDDGIIGSSINMKLSPVDTIKYFVRAYAEYYENYPAITGIVQSYDSLMCDTELSEKVRSILNKRSDFILKNIKQAQESGVIKRNINSELLENLIIGGPREVCLKWRAANYNFSIKETTVEMINMLLEEFLE